MGCGAKVVSKKKKSVGELFKQIEPQDLVKFGLIPEFVGRVPAIVSLENLDKDALIRILTEPKNALVKQYEHLFDLDGIKLEFDKDALIAIAELAIDRETGARGLRAIFETMMRDTMYDAPSMGDALEKIIIHSDVIKEGKTPTLVYNEQVKPKAKGKKANNESA